MSLLCVRKWRLMTPPNHWLLEFLVLQFSDRTLSWLAYVSLCPRARYKCPYLEGNVEWKVVVPSSLIIVPVYARRGYTLYLQRLLYHNKKWIVNECFGLEPLLRAVGSLGFKRALLFFCPQCAYDNVQHKASTFNRVVIFQPSISFALSIAYSFVFWLIPYLRCVRWSLI